MIKTIPFVKWDKNDCIFQINSRVITTKVINNEKKILKHENNL